MVASAHGHLDVVQLLLSKDANPNAVNKVGFLCGNSNLELHNEWSFSLAWLQQQPFSSLVGLIIID